MLRAGEASDLGLLGTTLMAANISHRKALDLPPRPSVGMRMERKACRQDQRIPNLRTRGRRVGEGRQGPAAQHHLLVRNAD